MPESFKVGVVYTGQAPQLFGRAEDGHAPWRLEYFSAAALFSGPFLPKRDFAALFYPAGDGPAGLRHRFPGAELIPYALCGSLDAAAEPERRPVELPMPFPVAQALLETLAVSAAHRRELGAVRKRAHESRDFLEAFVNVVESSWNVADRKLGISVFMNRALSRIGADECIIYLAEEPGAPPQRWFATGSIGDTEVFDAEANASIVESVLNSGTPYLNNDCAFEPHSPFVAQGTSIRSVLCHALERRGERIGAIEFVSSQAGAFTDEDQRLVCSLVEPLTVALRTTHMFETAERLTVTDDLTKLYNYRYLMQYIESEVRRCLRYKKKLSLLFIDVDGFKRINDNFGHLVGSQALAEMGQVFRRILRETDVVGRYGGDEFVIVLPETPLNGAMVIAERIRKKVEDYDFIAQNVSIRLTVSLGVANCPKHTLTAEGLIKKADAAMYRAKEISRNSIRVAV